VPLDEYCRKHDSFPARALALDSILTHTTDNRAAPWKPRRYARALTPRIDTALVQTAR